MSEDVKIENKFIATLGAELIEDMTVNLLNVRDKSMTVSTIRTKWVMKYFREKEALRKFKKAKHILLQVGIDKLQTTDVQYRSMSRVRLEEHICRDDPKVKKLSMAIDQQQEVIQFMEYALNIVSDFNFTVKHALDAIKLEQG